MNVFITGATGKVGSRFVPRMLQRGHRVTLLVRDAAKADQLRQQGAELTEGDLLQPDLYASALRGSDAVIHLAAQFRGVDENTTRSSNVDGTAALARAALQAGVPRFVFASTNNVYGSSNRSRPNREDDALNPAFAYPRSKAEAETALLTLHRESGLGLRIVRLPFVYGERDPHIAEFLPFLRNWHPAKRFHMAHHADVGQALMLAASTPGIDGRIYNVGDDAPVSVAELLQLHRSFSAPEALQQEFNAWDMVVDTTRIRDELHYRPIYPSFYTARDAGAL
ncbi:NAD-dependent epimerase/dehydratase family protein [Paenibacillus sacheonensis]|uniref:NAD-dependent epimerase/dehydratase family protein n=1 Tax=Paenibacillus sacheonensis TaxID=742054 RepID=A0A7X4YPS3_9BACL|nr:NAD(P)-dependent oxidoreductase [Paenibacillus sacheonensis]MBM7565611.1 nucleoside-diphosphate-sugar epimerase [Paenibacillus sacheonensis]NBC69471.1 NAD-dependent epimerase/dehydratase family protein [Paenibacillus sacheonensis]